MILLPAIDISDGKCVRLRQGKKEEKTIYSDVPASIAKKWESEGASYLHVVDLDRTIDGVSHNVPVIADIVQSVSIPVELGGGLRTIEAIREAFQSGIARVIIGTMALIDPDFLKLLMQEFGPDKIIVGIDASNGKVAIKGWTEITDQSAVDAARKVQKAGVQRIVYTDISRDGMLVGVNVAAIKGMIEKTDLHVIASGGVASLNDVHALMAIAHPRLEGCIVGKALYEGQFNLKQALELLKQ